MIRVAAPWILALALSLPLHARALATIDFEGLPDGTVLNTQFAGLTFSHALALEAGISLNEFEFPPHSGTLVASDDGGAIELVFAAPATAVTAFFTYNTALTLTAFDSSNNVVAVAGSLFGSNLALSGAPGSSANEPITLSFAAGFSRLVIAGDPAGGSYTMDDLSVSVVPEPGSALLLLAGGPLLMAAVARRRRGVALRQLSKAGARS
jgi:hypothetical protein